MRIPRRLLAGAQLGRQQGHRRGALRHVVTRLGPDYPSAAACLAEDLPALVLHLRYPGRLRHRDHRFEWTRAEFQEWAHRVGAAFAYDVRFLPVGPDDHEVGPPTQLAVFTKAVAA